MDHEVTEHDEAVVIAFTDEVDLQTSPEAREILLQWSGGGKPVVVDLSKVAYIDSSGIASLVEALQTARKGGGDLLLAAPSDAAMRVLELARLDKVFTICPDLDEALGKVGG